MPAQTTRLRGPVMDVPLDELKTSPQFYTGKAVRTRGLLERGLLSTPGPTAGGGDRSRATTGFQLCSRFTGCLRLDPVAALAAVLEAEALPYLGREVEVEGIYARVGTVAGDPDRPQGAGLDAIEIWQFLGPLERTTASADPGTGAHAPRAPAPPPPPPPLPAIVMSLPLDGERIAQTVRFHIQFSRDMDEDSFAGRVVLRYAVPRAGDREFDGLTVDYDVYRMTLIVDPGDLLQPGRSVELLLLEGIADLESQALERRKESAPYERGVAEILRFAVGDDYGER